MQKIIPNLWFDTQAKEAAELYTKVFPNSKIQDITTIKDTPSGDCDMVTFDVWDYTMMSISAGPYFKLNPSISFMVNFDPKHMENAESKMDEIWEKLIDGGKALMPLDTYDFSKHYGWVEDKYGVSWQLILSDPTGDDRPAILPAMLFTQEMAGKTEEATDFYISIFKNSKRGLMARYPAGMEFDKEGTVMYTDFMLEGQWFVAMDSAAQHEFKFSEATSLVINCKDQAEIDYFWEKLSAVPESEQCGWVKDKYGVSWQIQPENMGELMSANPEKTTPVMLKMKKIIIAELEEAGRK